MFRDCRAIGDVRCAEAGIKTRRLFLKTLLAAGTLPLAPHALRQSQGLRARPLGGGFHEVEGWILTDADLEALQRRVS